MKLTTKLATSALSVSILIYLCIRFTDPPDFCAADQVVLSDLEFKRAAFNLLALQRRDEFTEAGDPLKTRRKIYDEVYSKWRSGFSLDNCCAVTRENSLWRRITGTQKVVVEIWPSEHGDEKGEQIYDVCGWLKSSDFGLPNSVKKPIKITDQGLQNELRLESNWNKRDY